jgi:hypothetical protein
MRERDRFVEAGITEWDEGQHVERADARVRTAMVTQVDPVVRRARQGESGGDHLRRASDCRDHAAVMHGIAGAVHDACSGDLHRFNTRVDHRRVAPLADVRHDFELVLYRRNASIDSSGCAGSARPPRFFARNASTAALKRLLFSGRAKPWPSSGKTTYVTALPFLRIAAAI